MTVELDTDEGRALIAAGWPDWLIKATIDPFDYVVQIRSGHLVQFEQAKPCENLAWVRLLVSGEHPLMEGSTLPFDCPRGVEVRVADILWIADAPNGS